MPGGVSLQMPRLLLMLATIAASGLPAVTGEGEITTSQRGIDLAPLTLMRRPGQRWCDTRKPRSLHDLNLV
jgi:hypothetical protein